jgi:hypothetical protein
VRRHVDGLDHGLVAADPRAFRRDRRAGAADQPDIRRRPANVRDDGVGQAGQVRGADLAGRRAAEDRLDRPGAGESGGDQRAVASDEHQRCIDFSLYQNGVRCRNQI